jgi:phage tail sheath protein FI
MPEYLSPGVFIEEVPSAVQTITAVSTSTMGIVGFFSKGPTDEAKLITSSEQLTRFFGELTPNSFAPLSVLAFFANGGRRCYVTRVMPSDAVLADLDIQSKQYSQQIESGDGAVVAFTKTSSTTALKVNGGDSPLVGSNPVSTGLIQIRWRAAGTPVAVHEATRNRDDSANVALVDGTDSYEFRINPASIPALAEGDLEQLAVVPDSTAGVEPQLSWEPLGAGAITLSLAHPTTGTVSTTTNAQGTVVVFDFATGRGSVKFGGTDVPGLGATGNLGIAFTPATTTFSCVDDGSGALVDEVTNSLAAPGTIDYNTGAYSFTAHASAVPHEDAAILCTYSIAAWDLAPISKGVWANSVRVVISGSANYFDVATQTYSRFDVTIRELNSATGLYDVKESYEELDFSDATSAQFFADALNELSDYVIVTIPGADEAPGALAGRSATTVLVGGDESVTTNRTLAGEDMLLTKLQGAGFAVAPRTVTLAYTDSTGTARTITDDGSGGLSGDVDPSYVDSVTVFGVTLLPNTIDYATGLVNVRTVAAVQGGSVVTATYTTTAESSAVTEQFGDTNKQYTDSLAIVHYLAGSDGTFTAGTFSRAQFTAPTLISVSQGVYAFNRVDEILTVIVPDFAGDVTVTGDLLDYAESRAAQPSGGDRFIVLTTPIGSDPQEAVDWFRYDLGRYSKYAALYWPWVVISDPLTTRPMTFPPLGHIAGVYARTDATKNVGKAPGGTVDGALQFLLRLEYVATQGERDFVYPNKINPLISSPQTGLAVWGVRSIAIESEWKYVHARRLFMFLEKSVYNSTAWIVFENNGPALWARIRAQLNGFLLNLFNSGYFAGTNPSQAYFVICDSNNNTQAEIDNGQVIIDVGVAVNKPAEFVRFRFQQLAAS